MVVSVKKMGDRVFIRDFDSDRFAAIWEKSEDEMYFDGDIGLIKDYVGQRNGLNYFGEDWTRHHKKGHQAQAAEQPQYRAAA